MVIERLTEKNIPQVTHLHKRELPGFLSQLGEGFLEKFYRATFSIPELFIFVFIENEHILGFVCGTHTTGDLYKKIFLKDKFGFGMIFLKYFITHFKDGFKLIQILNYPGFTIDGPELLTIAVDRQSQNKGIGKRLFERAVREFKKKGIKKFKVSVYDCMAANGFYRKMGCRQEKSFNFLGQKMNYYSYKI